MNDNELHMDVVDNVEFDCPPVEPKAEYRTMAGELWQWQTALTEVGFTDEQAFALVHQFFSRMGMGAQE